MRNADAGGPVLARVRVATLTTHRGGAREGKQGRARTEASGESRAELHQGGAGAGVQHEEVPCMRGLRARRAARCASIGEAFRTGQPTRRRFCRGDDSRRGT